MPSFLPHGLSPAEIRVLQEFRRLAAEELTLEQIRAIKHPAGGGEEPAWRLVERGWLSTDEGRQKVALTDPSRELLAYDPVPENEAG